MSTHSNHAYRHFSLPPPPIPHTPVPTESARIRRVSTGANVRGEGWKLAGRPKTLSFHDQKTHLESVGATIVEPKTPGTYFHTSAPRESTSFVGGFVLPPQPLPHTAPNSAPAMYHHHHHHHQQHQQPAYNEATHMAPPVRHYSAPEYNGKSVLGSTITSHCSIHSILYACRQQNMGYKTISNSIILINRPSTNKHISIPHRLMFFRMLTIYSSHLLLPSLLNQ